MKLVVFEDSEYLHEGSDTYLLYVENSVNVMTLWSEYRSVPYEELKIKRGVSTFAQPFDAWCLEWGYSEEIPLNVVYEGN